MRVLRAKVDVERAADRRVREQQAHHRLATLWAKVDAAIDADVWAERSLAREVAFSAGRRFAFDGKKRPFLRLGFAALDEGEIREAVERMVEAL